MGKICVQNVEVTIDNIEEKGISSQIFSIANSALNEKKFLEKAGFDENGKNYALAINVNERSFFKDIQSARSLYTHYRLFSEDGECVLEKVFCSESKNSILSTVTQQRQIERIAKDLKKFFSSGTSDEA